MKSVKKNINLLSEAANLLLRANTKFLQGEMLACEELTEMALRIVYRLKKENELSADIQLLEKQLQGLKQMLSVREDGLLFVEKSALPLKIEARLNLLRACISRGNIKASRESFKQMLVVLSPELRIHPDILEIEKILEDISD